MELLPEQLAFCHEKLAFHHDQLVFHHGEFAFNCQHLVFNHQKMFLTFLFNHQKKYVTIKHHQTCIIYLNLYKVRPPFMIAKVLGNMTIVKWVYKPIFNWGEPLYFTKLEFTKKNGGMLKCKPDIGIYPGLKGKNDMIFWYIVHFGCYKLRLIKRDTSWLCKCWVFFT